MFRWCLSQPEVDGWASWGSVEHSSVLKLPEFLRRNKYLQLCLLEMVGETFIVSSSGPYVWETPLGQDVSRKTVSTAGITGHSNPWLRPHSLALHGV